MATTQDGVEVAPGQVVFHPDHRERCIYDHLLVEGDGMARTAPRGMGSVYREFPVGECYSRPQQPSERR